MSRHLFALRRVLRGGKPYGCPGHDLLAGAQPPRQLFHNVPVPVAGREIHPGIHARRLVSQDPLGRAVRFDELVPFGGVDEA